jgi:hypothetical protein
MDQVQARLLVVGRGFLDRAQLLGEDGSETARMGAVVLADLAVEMAAKAAVQYEPLSGRARLDRDPPLPAVLEALTKRWQQREGTTDDVPEAREAGRLHETRNSVQHAGMAPSSDQVLQSRVGTRRFLEWVATDWFGVPLESVSRAQLIENEAVRSLVVDAEQLAARDDYGTAGERLAAAFEMARRSHRAEMRDGQFVKRISPGDIGRAVSEVDSYDAAGGSSRRFREVMYGFAEQIERLSDQVEALTLGARASDYAWFKRSFPRFFESAGSLVMEPLSGTVITPDVYLRGLDFVTTTALHWQEFPIPRPHNDPHLA